MLPASLMSAPSQSYEQSDVDPLPDPGKHRLGVFPHLPLHILLPQRRQDPLVLDALAPRADEENALPAVAPRALLQRRRPAGVPRRDEPAAVDAVPPARREEEAELPRLGDGARKQPDQRRQQAAHEEAQEAGRRHAAEEGRVDDARVRVHEADARVRGRQLLEGQGPHGGAVDGGARHGEVRGPGQAQVVLLQGALLAARQHGHDVRARGRVEEGEQELGDAEAGVVPRRQAGLEAFGGVCQRVSCWAITPGALLVEQTYSAVPAARRSRRTRRAGRGWPPWP